MDDMRLSQAMAGFNLACHARSLSPNTIMDYTRTLRKFQALHPEDPLVRDITTTQIEEFLSLQDVSNKSLLNFYIGLSAFWTWCLANEIATRHVVRKVTPPKPESKAVIPFTQAEVKAILAAVERSRTYFSKSGMRYVSQSNHFADRNYAIILVLLDTGLRATELCNLTIGDVDLQTRSITSMGKGRKQRHIPMSNRTSQAIWKYKMKFRDGAAISDPLFLSSGKFPMSRDSLAHTLSDIGQRAGINNAHPHRFRHTFAINYLRNGGDIYTLQAILGHSTLEMVRRYLALAQVDLENAHRRASPVENWKL